jgi:hypothetical protein
LDEYATRLAITAHIRHVETPNDELLMKGYERQESRARVLEQVERIMQRWEQA